VGGIAGLFVEGEGFVVEEFKEFGMEEEEQEGEGTVEVEKEEEREDELDVEAGTRFSNKRSVNNSMSLPMLTSVLDDVSK